jgi:hypothetical protein
MDQCRGQDLRPRQAVNRAAFGDISPSTIAICVIGQRNVSTGDAQTTEGKRYIEPMAPRD